MTYTLLLHASKNIFRSHSSWECQRTGQVFRIFYDWIKDRGASHNTSPRLNYAAFTRSLKMITKCRFIFLPFHFVTRGNLRIGSHVKKDTPFPFVSRMYATGRHETRYPVTVKDCLWHSFIESKQPAHSLHVCH